ncbi:SusD/RagB family nutrient-binding outer membrane lipoprotein [Aureisphaera sp. CAU 1614]|uniref:SusD/RagB family nutrient-binding outer membrane lipoprotein n=1 Tax=Halomarinibacterium sedimenti TaxID=2857106 RepID=A0A9X1K0T5_9FLAO|nr:SusD/RagB family nutrient-binding outer membrane lipoprotein [Halomarinibacterium sedimenti]MBW2938746.1 SusD/RagB family nutrient-binding outer membrane lipoprotein [Halomarinibacterium sedimenti]
MKKIQKISIFVFLLLGLAFTSCETTELDLLDDPNDVTLDKANLDRFLNEIQLNFASFMRQIGNNDAQLVRVNYMFGRTYRDNFEPAVLDGEWALAYQGMFSDMAAAEPLAVDAGANKHLGVMKILKAYTLITLVDNFGDVPFSQATNPTEFPAPVADPGASVYAGALAMLDEGMVLISSEGDNLENDFYYDNDFSKWRRLANSVKMLAYLNTGDLASFNSVSGSAIVNSADDFQFQYGSNETNPDTRHPSYSTDYTTSGAGSYESNWLMETMLESNDPRIRYYFYRQFDCTPGAADADGNECGVDTVRMTCSGAPRPNHYTASMTYCSVDSGYWGRDHGNAEGIPPDGLRRTVNGVYPAGGKFDGDEYSPVVVGDGGGGAGILPIMLASYTDFMRAEAALASNNTSGAASALNSALTKSIAKTQGFISLDPSADSTFAPTSGEVSSFISGVVNSFNSGNANDKWEILATQQFIGNFGSGIGAYNLYRRTGYPKLIQFNIDPNPGAFVRSFFYPSNEANVNSNITQKPNVDVQVFWDTNPASPGFPSAN